MLSSQTRLQHQGQDNDGDHDDDHDDDGDDDAGDGDDVMVVGSVMAAIKLANSNGNMMAVDSVTQNADFGIHKRSDGSDGSDQSRGSGVKNADSDPDWR